MLTIVAAAAAAPLPHGSRTVHLGPAEFSTTIDNPYWPMKPGSRWVYRETDSEGTKATVVVTVTNETKLIANGITARVVRDKASIVSLREQAEVPAGHYRRVLMTRDVNPLSPKVLEYQFFARGVGPVLAVSVSGGSDREELIRYTRGQSASLAAAG